MSGSVGNNFYNLASTFQQSKIAAAGTEAGQTYSAAKGALKGAFADYRVAKGGVDVGVLAKEFFTDESTQAKAAKKFAEWMKKPVKIEERKEEVDSELAQTEVTLTLAEKAARFEVEFLASKKSDEVMAARAAKKAFKVETREQLKAGKSVAELQAQVNGLSAKTIGKIAYWAAKFKA